METRCSLCHRSVEEIAKEAIENMHYNTNSINVSITEKLVPFYPLCDECEEFLRSAIPAILEDMGVVSFDEEKEIYILTTK